MEPRGNYHEKQSNAGNFGSSLNLKHRDFPLRTCGWVVELRTKGQGGLECMSNERVKEGID